MADGFEAIEALTPIDVMLRAGIEIRRISTMETLEVTASNKSVSFTCDGTLDEVDPQKADAIIIPGGNPGFVNLGANARVLQIVRDFWQAGKVVAAICGGPTVLAKAGVARGSRITCHHSVAGQMLDYQLQDSAVEVDSKLVTGAGAGVSVPFSLAVLEKISSKETVDRVKAGMEYR